MIDKGECKQLLKIAKPFIKLNSFFKDNGINQSALSKFINSEGNDAFISKEKVNDLCEEIYNACCCYRDIYEDTVSRADDGILTRKQVKTEKVTTEATKLIRETKEKENNSNKFIEDKEQLKYLDDLMANEMFGIIGEYWGKDSYSLGDMMEIILKSYALGKKRGLESK